MKFWSRVTRILLATVVASQGAVFLPAMAASQSKRLAVKAIGIEEIKSEYGAGGGGGGVGPGPVVVDPGTGGPKPTCQYGDSDSDSYCDVPDVNHAMSSTRVIYSGNEYPTVLNSSAWYHCVSPDSANNCTGTWGITVETSRTYSASVSGSGSIGKIESAVGFSASYTFTDSITISPNFAIPRGYAYRLVVYNAYYRIDGDYNAALVDSNGGWTGNFRYHGSWVARKPLGRTVSTQSEWRGY